MTKPKRYKRYSSEFKREAILRAGEEGSTDTAVCEEPQADIPTVQPCAGLASQSAAARRSGWPTPNWPCRVLTSAQPY